MLAVGTLFTLLTHGVCSEPLGPVEDFDISDASGIILDSRFVRIVLNMEELWYKVLIGDRVCWVYETWVKET